MNGIARAAFFGAVMLISGHAMAQDFPSRPLTFIVPYPPGGITDQSARVIGKVLAEKLGQPVIVENKPGAQGLVGTEHVVRSKPDGYTFIYATVSSFGAYAYQFKKISFDPFTALTPVHGMTTSSMLFMVRADAPYKTYSEFVAYAKKNPDAINYYTVGPGSSHHLFGEELQRSGGFRMTQVPYKGSTAAATDLLSGVIQVGFIFPVTMIPMIKDGKMRALGVSGPERLAILPDVPTFAEMGYKDAVYTGWSAIAVPAGTPQDVIDKLAKAFDEALQHPSVVAYVREQGSGTLTGYSGEKLQTFITSEVARMKTWLERAGVQPE
jgi:tripartite-type tricarboxylate transporter receptor subunit TctC